MNRHDPLPIHGGRSGDVDQAMVGRGAHEEDPGPTLRLAGRGLSGKPSILTRLAKNEGRPEPRKEYV